LLWTERWLLLAAVACGCGSRSDAPPAAKADNTTRANGEAPQARQIDLKHPVVRIETSLGAIRVRLDGEKAHGTVSNFVNYVNEGFYTNTIFHYVAPGKMIIGGGFSPNYELRPTRSTIRNEADNGRKNVRGTIAMARDSSLIDSASTQFFINLEDAPQRDYKGDTPDSFGYCVFGEVLEGLDVAERISQAPTADLSQKSEALAQTPKSPVVISAIRIEM
jgi:cyclophilin family peptidyl-prolyl cis-trans isomerase